MAHIDLHWKRTTAADADFKSLVHLLDAELRGRYGAEQDNFDPLNILSPSTPTVLGYTQQREAVACGCFRVMEEGGQVEIKRMYVLPTFRNQGIARTILFQLEQWAREEGYHTACLETGVLQPEAIAAYHAAGYTRIDNYGHYVNSSYSVCMAKKLSVNDPA